MNRTTYCIDVQRLRDQGTDRDTVGFEGSSIAALQIPEKLEDTMSLLLWGVVVNSTDCLGDFKSLLPTSVRDKLPTTLYVAGWSIMQMDGILGGCVNLMPWAPTLDPNTLTSLSLSIPGKPNMNRARNWPCQRSPVRPAFEMTCDLEHPYSLMYLSLFVEGTIQLYLDPRDCVPLKQCQLEYERYGHDTFRLRQLRKRKSELGIE